MDGLVQKMVQRANTKYEVDPEDLKFSYSGIDLSGDGYATPNSDDSSPENSPNISRRPSIENLSQIKSMRRDSVLRKVNLEVQEVTGSSDTI